MATKQKTTNKPQIPWVILVISLFFFQSCATLVSGTSSGIPITSNPPGTKVLADGQVMGETPTLVKFKKNKDHTIRLEKEGYNPLEIRIVKTGQVAGFNALTIGTDIVAGVLIGLVIGYALVPESEKNAAAASALFGVGDKSSGSSVLLPILGMILGGFTVPFVDSKLGGTSRLAPEELSVTLEDAAGQAQAQVIFIDPDDFQRVKWIRIK